MEHLAEQGERFVGVSGERAVRMGEAVNRNDVLGDAPAVGPDTDGYAVFGTYDRGADVPGFTRPGPSGRTTWLSNMVEPYACGIAVT